MRVRGTYDVHAVNRGQIRAYLWKSKGEQHIVTLIDALHSFRVDEVGTTADTRGHPIMPFEVAIYELTRSYCGAVVMTKLASQMESLLKERGAAVVGAAPAAAAADAIKVHGRRLLEDAQTAICFGYAVPESVFAADVLGEALYWRTANMLYRRIDVVALEAAARLEARGYRSLPLFSCFPQYTERPRYLGAVQLVPIAVAAGLGALAKCGLLFSPHYGLRLLLGGILTAAKIGFSTRQEPIACPADCWKCIEACPVHAISRSGSVDHERCLRHSTRNPLLTEYVRNEALRSEYGFDLLLNTLGAEDHTMYTCIACARACPKNYRTHRS